MYILCSLDEGLSVALANWIACQSDAKIVIGSLDQCGYGISTFVIDAIRAEIDVLKLHILHQDPSLHLLPLTVDMSRLLYQIYSWYCLLWFLGCLKFLVLLYDCIACLYLYLVSIYLFLWKGNATNLLKDLRGIRCLELALSEAYVFKSTVHI